MKNLLLLLAVAAGGYYLYTEHFAATAIDVDSYHALLQKVEATSVSLDEVTLQRILGHGDIKMTMRYSHLAPDHFATALTMSPLALL